MSKILLVEPGYRNKYPPLGLMKLSTFHKTVKKHKVDFVKGTERINYDVSKYDRIYVTTLFTFYWKKTIETIEYYLKRKSDDCTIYIGGIMSSILCKEIEKYFYNKKVKVIPGILTNSKKIGYRDNTNIDVLTPDYNMLNLVDYEYKHSKDYMIFTTRGCIRNCVFCVVPKIEPIFCKVNDLLTQINNIKDKYGELHNLIIMDNNILALDFKDLKLLVEQIIALGYGASSNWYYYKDSKGNSRKKRKYVDFNQGLDARLLTPEKMELLSRIAVRPLRIAFDHANNKFINLYESKIELAHKHGIKYLSNYLLFNYQDRVEDFYKRAEINVMLNEVLGTKIFSFPMKYSPIIGVNNKDRKYVGLYWTKKELRGIQCILAATHGVIGPREKYFRHAFGKNIEEFKCLLLAPENYIIYRDINKDNYIQWKKELKSLDSKQLDLFHSIIDDNKMVFKNEFVQKLKILRHYFK